LQVNRGLVLVNIPLPDLALVEIADISGRVAARTRPGNSSDACVLPRIARGTYVLMVRDRQGNRWTGTVELPGTR
jgi:hypothetical protein